MSIPEISSGGHMSGLHFQLGGVGGGQQRSTSTFFHWGANVPGEGGRGVVCVTLVVHSILSFFRENRTWHSQALFSLNCHFKG